MQTKICYKNPSKHTTIEYYCVLSFIDIFVSGVTLKGKTHENPNFCYYLTSSFLLYLIFYKLVSCSEALSMLLPPIWTAETQISSRINKLTT